MTTLEFMRKAYHNKIGAYSDAQKRKGATEEELRNIREKISHFKKAIEALEKFKEIEPDSNHSVCKDCVHCKSEEWEKDTMFSSAMRILILISCFGAGVIGMKNVLNRSVNDG